MITKTKIKTRKRNKTSAEIVETINAALKNNAWHKIAQKASAGRREYDSVNLRDIESKAKDGDTIVVVGKVLGNGELNKKVRICAINFSSSAIEKMKKSKSEHVKLIDEINKNPKATGVKVLP